MHLQLPAAQATSTNAGTANFAAICWNKDRVGLRLAGGAACKITGGIPQAAAASAGAPTQGCALTTSMSPLLVTALLLQDHGTPPAAAKLCSAAAAEGETILAAKCRGIWRGNKELHVVGCNTTIDEMFWEKDTR